MTDATTYAEVIALLRELREVVDRPPKAWLTPEETGAYLGIARATVYKWVHAGVIPHHKIPGSSLVRFRVSELDQWIEQGRDRSNGAVNEVLKKLR